MESPWNEWVVKAFHILASQGRIGFLRPVSLSPEDASTLADPCNFETLDGPRPGDRSSAEVAIDEPTFYKWLHDIPSSAAGELELNATECGSKRRMKKLLLYSSNDYLALTSHPAVRKVAAKAALELGMGPRSSALMCGYTDYHRLLESTLADLKNKEECLLLPSGFAANLTLMAGIGSIASLLSDNGRPRKDERVAIFSDALNHASIIDGLRFVERHGEVEVYVYKHCDMTHLDKLLSNCPLKRKVVITDGLFSMDGDFCPLDELVALRKKNGFLLIVDDAHGSFICGENGRGVAEMFKCEKDVDLFVGTLSKAGGCVGGFISCSKSWKQILQSRGRSFIFTTALPVPVVAAAYAAVIVAKKEKWRRQAVWDLVDAFSSLTKIPVASPIISLILGDEKTCHKASRDLLKLGFHVIAVTSPVVPPNSCRLRISLSAAHTLDDIKRLVAALSHCIDLSTISTHASKLTKPTYAKL